MMKMTSAVANKLIKKLNADKMFWVNKERESCTYVASLGEEPVIPDYDYLTVANEIAAIDSKVAIIKHAINFTNATNTIMVGDEEMTIDTALVKMAQLNSRVAVLDRMRMNPQKARVNSYSSRNNSTPEYQYINYDLELVKKEYETVSNLITSIQIALDKYNQTVEFEVEI